MAARKRMKTPPTLGIVGYGAFGRLVHTLATRFVPQVTVRVHSSRHTPNRKTFYPLAEVAASDAVVLAVPIHAFEAVLRQVLPHVRPDTVIVDIATVKVHTVALLRRLARGRRWIATHPMWGPESYLKRGGNVTGFRVIVCEHTLSRTDYARARGVLHDIGFDIVEMGARRHDKHLAETLFLTHFIGQIVHRAGFDRTVIDTVSFGFLMDAVESVRHDEALFRDVFTYNPYCKRTLDLFQAKETAVRHLLERT